MTKALSRLAVLELEIEKGIRGVGQALIEVRDSKLWKAAYESFEAYCMGRWGFKKSRAYQMIEAEETMARISTIVENPPTKESHLREISKIPETLQANVTAEVLERCEAENREPTAKDFKAAAKPFIKPPEPAGEIEEVYEDVEEPASTVDPRLDAAALITAASRENDRLVNDLRRLADMVGGEWLKADLQHIIASLREVKFSINQTVFWIDCPLCKNGCKECKKIGWLSKGREKFLSTEAKAKL